MFEREYRDLQFVPRWAIARTIRTQSVAEHSFFVAVYAADIVRLAFARGLIKEEELIHCVTYAIFHDRGESFMSDIPGPVKRSIKDAKKLDAFEASMEKRVFGNYFDPPDYAKAVVKCADLMDEWAFMNDEKWLGNVQAEALQPKIMERLSAAVQNLPWFEAETKSELLQVFLFNTTREKVYPENNSDVVANGRA